MNPTLTPDHLKLFRSHFDLTQTQAAKLLSVSRVTWCRWESGRYTLPAYLIHTLRAVVADLKAAQVVKLTQEAERATLGL